MRCCKVCNKEQDENNFQICKYNKSGNPVRKLTCNSCRSKNRRLSRKSNPHNIRQYEKEYYHKNIETKKTQNKRKWAKHKDKYNRQRKVKTPEKSYSQYKFSAKKKNRDFVITFEQFLHLRNSTCQYCGNVGNNGLDRVDSSKGYTLDNVVSCCTTCNVMKNTLSVEQFKQHLHKIINYLR